MLLELTEDNLQELVEGNEKVIVQFGATWCGACKVMKPRLSKMAEETEGVTFIYADVEQQPKSSTFTVIRNLPTFVGVVNGEVIAKEVGSKPENLANLVESIKQAK